MRTRCRTSAFNHVRLAVGHARSCAILLVCLFGALSGCRTLARSGPTPPAVTSCRQLTQQGASAMERGDWKRAETYLAKAVQTCAVDPDSRRNYAEALWHRGALQEALAQFEQARRLAGDDPVLAVRVGELQMALGHPEQSTKLVDEALATDPKFAPAWALRGRVAAAAGQPRQALADYQRSLAYAPDNTQVNIAVAETYRQLNEPERALVTLQSVSDKYARGEEPQQVLYLEGLALTSLGRYEAASGVLLKAAQREQPTAEIMCRLAEAQLMAGRVRDAHGTVQHALALDPAHVGSQALSTRLAMVAGGSTVTR